MSRFVVTRGFGNKDFPQFGDHDGLDIDNGGPMGDPILAMDSGRVTHRYEDANGARIIRIRHSDGWSTGYAHLARFDVLLNQDVKQGQQIGLLGASGFVTGPHLHFDTEDPSGIRHDPWTLLEQNTVKIAGVWVGHKVNAKAATTSPGNFRSGVTRTSPAIALYPVGTVFIAVCEVKGEAIGTAADRDRWYGGILFETGQGHQFGYFHSSLLTRTADGSGVAWSSGSSVELLKGRREGAQAVVDAAEAAAAKMGATP